MRRPGPTSPVRVRVAVAVDEEVEPRARPELEQLDGKPGLTRHGEEGGEQRDTALDLASSAPASFCTRRRSASPCSTTAPAKSSQPPLERVRRGAREDETVDRPEEAKRGVGARADRRTTAAGSGSPPRRSASRAYTGEPSDSKRPAWRRTASASEVRQPSRRRPTRALPWPSPRPQRTPPDRRRRGRQATCGRARSPRGGGR